MRVVKHYDMLDCLTGGEPYQKTQVTASIDETHLRLTFSGRNVCPKAMHSTYNAPLYEGDIYELLMTLDAPNRYLEVEIDPNGTLYVVIITNRDGEGDIEIEYLDTHRIEAMTDIRGELWTADLTLDMQWLRSLGYQEPVFWNLLRQDFGEDGVLHLSCVSPTYAPSFHKPKAFVEVK